MPVYNTKKKKIWNEEKRKWEWIPKDNPETTKDGREWYFMVSYTNLSGEQKRYKSKKFFTEKEAIEEEALFILKNKEYQNTNITIKDLCDSYINYISNELKPSSVYKIKNRINLHILPFFSNIKAMDLTKQKYRQWKESLDKKEVIVKSKSTKKKVYTKPLSLKYKNTLHSLMVSIFNYGISYHDLTINVPSLVGRFKDKGKVKKEFSFITYEQFLKLENAIKSNPDENIRKRDLVIFSMLYYAGLRKGELQAIKCSDIDNYLKTGILKINKTVTLNENNEKYIMTTPKTKSSIRSIKPPKKLYNYILDWFDYIKQFKNYSKDWFFIGTVAPIPNTTLARIKNNYFKKAKLNPIRIHDFRHSCASFLISKGIDIATVAKYLGHSSLSMTLDFYTHALPNNDDIIANTFDNL